MSDHVYRRLEILEQQVDSLHAIAIDMLLSLESAQIPVRDRFQIVNEFLARRRIQMRPALGQAQHAQPAMRPEANGASHSNGHALAKAV